MYSKKPITAYRVKKQGQEREKCVFMVSIHREIGFISSKPSEALFLLDFCLAQKNGYPSDVRMGIIHRK